MLTVTWGGQSLGGSPRPLGQPDRFGCLSHGATPQLKMAKFGCLGQGQPGLAAANGLAGLIFLKKMLLNLLIFLK